MMDVPILRAFLGWCTILNLIFFALAFLIYRFARDWIYRLHTRWFPVSQDTFHVALYAFFGLYEILIILLNRVPYVALSIAT